MSNTDSADVPYSQFICIGTGFSGIGLGATLKRWYGITDVQFFERELEVGGTWYLNSYPGKKNRTQSHETIPIVPILTTIQAPQQMYRTFCTACLTSPASAGPDSSLSVKNF